ncbi:MAG TPA: hypothetical protein VF519_10150 [Mycobacteriales bacterium]
MRSTAREQVVASLRQAFATLSASLVALDGDPDVAFVRPQPSAAARAVATAIGALWDRYPLVQDAVERSESDASQAAAAGAAVEEMRREVDRVVAEARALADRVRAALVAVEHATPVLARTEALAAEVGAREDPLVVAARTAMDRAVAAVAADPTDAPEVAVLAQHVADAHDHVAGLHRRYTALPDDLAAARALLDEVAALVADGATALAEAERKVRAPRGVLRPLDAAALDEPRHGLRPWLARIEREAAQGDWRPASVGLDRWREVAGEWRANARAVVAANRAPVERRDELRGLLDAYRAKGLATGRAETPDVEARYDAARAALYTAPCDLDAAERLVHEYVSQVNR